MPLVADPRGRRLGAAAVVAIAGGLMPLAAAAQSAAQPADRIDAIEHQIRTMEGELRQLKAELRQSRGEAARARAELRQAHEAAARATDAEAQAAQAAAQARAIAAAPPSPSPAPGPKIVQTAGNRFGIESADGRNSIYLTGRLHFDVGDYLSFQPQSKAATVQSLNSGVNARRARLGVTGKFAGDWNYTFIYDLGGSSDGFPPVPGAPSSGINNAYLTYNGLNKGPLPVAFDLGYIDTPFSLDEATSSNDIMFMERASIQTVATGLFANDNRSAFGARSNNDRYWGAP